MLIPYREDDEERGVLLVTVTVIMIVQVADRLQSREEWYNKDNSELERD
jgi:hypothetical protein